MMHSKSAVIVVICGLSLVAVAQDDAPKPKVSNASLSAEQLMIYRAVVADYTRGSSGKLNLSDTTEPLERFIPASEEGCTKGMKPPEQVNSVPMIHRIHPADASGIGRGLVLVDVKTQQVSIRANDPQTLIKSAIDDRQKVTEDQLDSSVKEAFATGLFTLSEIVFNKQHRRAVAAYSFVCGMLSGGGNAVILRKEGTQWRIRKRCGGWVS